MTIQINDKDIELKYSLRSMMIYENISGKSFNPQGLTDIITFMYCVIVSSSKDYSYRFDDFIDYLDANPELLTQFSNWLTNTTYNNNALKKE